MRGLATAACRHAGSGRRAPDASAARRAAPRPPQARRGRDASVWHQVRAPAPTPTGTIADLGARCPSGADRRRPRGALTVGRAAESGTGLALTSRPDPPEGVGESAVRPRSAGRCGVGPGAKTDDGTVARPAPPTGRGARRSGAGIGRRGIGCDGGRVRRCASRSPSSGSDGADRPGGTVSAEPAGPLRCGCRPHRARHHRHGRSGAADRDLHGQPLNHRDRPGRLVRRPVARAPGHGARGGGARLLLHPAVLRVQRSAAGLRRHPARAVRRRRGHDLGGGVPAAPGSPGGG